MATGGQQGPSRFDDLVRSERYFTATLLPAVLFHDGLRGLDAFLDLVEKAGHRRSTGPTERHREGPVARQARKPVWSPDTVEIITEFHIYRDLLHAGRLSRPVPTEPPSNGDVERRDAPDLVILLDDELVACEGKFFMDFNVPKLNGQLQSQRRQLSYLLETRSDIHSYRQVALLPEAPDRPADCDVVLTWGDVRDLSARVLGPEHYVTRRLRTATTLYESQIRESGVQNYDGLLRLPRVLDLCRAKGNTISVGHSGGVPSLQSMPVIDLQRKWWKWRDPCANQGKALEKNWIPGSTFLELVELRTSDGGVKV